MCQSFVGIYEVKYRREKKNKIENSTIKTLIKYMFNLAGDLYSIPDAFSVRTNEHNRKKKNKKLAEQMKVWGKKCLMKEFHHKYSFICVPTNKNERMETSQFLFSPPSMRRLQPTELKIKWRKKKVSRIYHL